LNGPVNHLTHGVAQTDDGSTLCQWVAEQLDYIDSSLHGQAACNEHHGLQRIIHILSDVIRRGKFSTV